MEQPTSLSRLSQLAATISSAASSLDAALRARQLPTPSFDEDYTLVLPEEGLPHRDAIIDAAAELQDLLLDPVTLLRHHGAHNNMVCLQAIARFGLARLVPRGGGRQISYAEMAEAVASASGSASGKGGKVLDEQVLARLLRRAMLMRVFREPEPGFVVHTHASRLLADSAVMADWLRVGSEEIQPASAFMLDALEKWPGSSEPNETGFSLANNSSASIYSILARDPSRSARFARAMEVFARSPGYDPAFLVDHYPWSDLGTSARHPDHDGDRRRPLVVDVGGARGHVAAALARAHPGLDLLVQDMEPMIEGAADELDPDLRARVRFAAHELLAPQTATTTAAIVPSSSSSSSSSSPGSSSRGGPPDALLFRWVLHNWPDAYCVRILRAQVPAMRRGTRVVIQDICMPERAGDVAAWREKDLRAFDLDMAALFNARERTVSEWRALIAQADERFVLKRVIEPRESTLAILEVVWEGEDS